jgi:hypothetical protein
MGYCFLVYSSTLAKDNVHSYEFGFGTSFFRIVGDKPFGRGDVCEVLSLEQRNSSEFRIGVRVLGDPRISGRDFDQSKRVELPTLLFLTSRIYLSEFSDYKIIQAINCEVISFRNVTQERNKVYAVAVLAKGTDCKLICEDPSTHVRIEWIIQSSKDLDKPAPDSFSGQHYKKAG